MQQRRWNLLNDRGNAVIEFVFIFTAGAAALLIFALQAELQLRDHLAALSVANETLRTYQLTESESRAITAASSVVEFFNLPNSVVRVDLQNVCAASKTILVRAQVREAIEVASANC